MSRILFAAICGWILFRYTNRWQRIIGVVLLGTVTVALVFPSPAYSQFGLLGSIQNVFNVITYDTFDSQSIQSSSFTRLNPGTDGVLNIQPRKVQLSAKYVF